jgi:hypothetical protein
MEAVMKHVLARIVSGSCAVALTASAALAETKGDELGSYLADIGPGPVAAHEILGLPAGVVTQVQSPKDIVVAIDKANGDAGKQGFGLSIAPARIGNGPLAVSIAGYLADPLKRLWGGTSFSYAQRTKAFDGTDYQESAAAVHVDYFLDANEDPVVAARVAFIQCAERVELTTEFIEEVNKRQEERRKKGAMSDEDFKTLKKEIMADVTYDKLKKAGQAAVKCVRDGYDGAKAKWNASQVGVTLGRGWIRGPSGGLGRISLAQHAAVTLAWSVKNMPDSLFNVTLRRVSKEVDTSTLAGTPSFGGSSLAAARYTYGHGDKQDTFLIAEISNAKASKLTEANASFKYAVGLDRKLTDGVWLEFRLGRSRVADGEGLETKALASLKFAPAPAIPKLLSGS